MSSFALLLLGGCHRAGTASLLCNPTILLVRTRSGVINDGFCRTCAGTGTAVLLLLHIGEQSIAPEYPTLPDVLRCAASRTFSVVHQGY